MVEEKLIAELGKKSPLFGGAGGGEFDDLDKIASELDTNKTDLLNNDIIKDIHVEQLRIRHGSHIDAIQFFYEIKTNDRVYSIEGNKHGGNGGKETIINLETDEYILNLSGRRGNRVDQLSFITYIASKKQIKTYGPYGGNGGSPFNLLSCTCAFGKSGHELDAFGIYEGKITSSYEKDNHQWETIFSILLPNQPYDFTQLKQEITRLKYQELAPQAREEKAKFEQLITDAKNKAGENFASVIDLLLETQQQINKIKPGSNEYHQAKGQLTAYQTILESSLTKEELQTLLTKQTELCQLEKHLVSLQQNQEQTAQILQTSLPKQ